MKKVIVLFLSVLMVLPVFAGGNSEDTGTIIGASVGGVSGAAAGAAAGAALGSVVPGVGNVVGAVIGGIAGGVAGGVGIGTAGAAGGAAIARAITPDSEYFRISTQFSYTQQGTDRISNVFYGAEGLSANQTFVPDFPVGSDVVLTISMTPVLVDDSATVPTNGIDIPVQILLKINGDIDIHRHGGISNVQEAVIDDSSTLYSFSFRSTGEAQRSISFRISPNDVGEVYVTVSYGANDQNIVTEDSDVFTTISFND